VPNNSERRRFSRQAIELPGLLTSPGSPVRRCVVRDQCAGGLLLELSGGEPPSIGQAVRVNVKLLLPEGARPLAMDGRVVWQRDRHCGVVFVAESPEWSALLGRHGSRAERSEASGAFDGGRVVVRLQAVARKMLPAVLRELLVDVNERLLQRADRVKSNTEQAQFFADMNALERLRKTDRLLDAIIAETERRDRPEPAAAGDGELSLIDADEFERWLEASRTAALLERHCGEQVAELGMRLGAMRAPAAGADRHAPFEPQHFTRALKVTAQELDLGKDTRAELFDAATHGLARRLPPFYEALHRELTAAGVPDAAAPTYRVVKQPVSAADDDARLRATEVPGQPSAPPTRAKGTGQGASGGHVPTAAPVDAGVLRQAREVAVQTRSARATEMFEEVTALPDMTDSLKGWLQGLEGPLKQAAIADGRLFHDRESPVRSVIDGLGHLQLFRPVPDAPEGIDELRREVDTLLAPMQAGDADDATVRSVAQGIDEITVEQSRRYQQNIERVVEAAEGRERVRQARARVVRVLNERYASHEVPDLVLDLLDTAWRSVLELAALRDRGADAAFAERLAWLDAVVSDLGGDAYDIAKPALVGEALLEVIAQELESTAFDPFRVTAVKRRLRQCLCDIPRGRAPLVRFDPLADEEETAIDPFGRPEGVDEEAWTAMLARCEGVRAGDRLRLAADHEGPALDLRVAWVRPDGGRYALVDHRGLRQRDITRAELALGLHRKAIGHERIDGQPLSERAADTLLSRMEQRLGQEAARDSLTGLMSRRQFQIALQEMLSRPDVDRGAMLWIDIDQFRLVNDMHGYDSGDQLVVAIARLLEEDQGFNVLSHFAGDQFAMLLPESTFEGAARRAEAICRRVAKTRFDLAGKPLTVTVSIGVVAVEATGRTVGEMLQGADDALGVAKRGGGNRVYRYDEEDVEIVRHRSAVNWVVRVDEALANGQLQLRCQPIVPVFPDSGLVPHYEVLLGVRDGQGESLAIGDFIDAAERYNRMRAVDRWVARTTLEWIAAHRELMPRLHNFAVNLSGQTASDPGFVEYLRQQLQRTGVDPSWLSLEITETAAVSDLSASAGIVQELKLLGCRVALDDFGSGLASYSYLKELPVDWLKIDGAFVSKIAADSGDYAVVKSINDIGHFLGKETIAEYVSDQRILRLVAEIGVDYVQGFAIAKPGLMEDLAGQPADALHQDAG
jgi:diguanylate cyclase (GGDEF)-like protein